MNNLACKLSRITKPKGSYNPFICGNIIRFDSTTSEEFGICFSHKLGPVLTLRFSGAKFSVKVNAEDQCVPSSFYTSAISKAAKELNVIPDLQFFCLLWMEYNTPLRLHHNHPLR